MAIAEAAPKPAGALPEAPQQIASSNDFHLFLI
jgi:hypothetical protein